eukprot:SAG25_NODE_219_length_11644_cov_21.713729_7_plen_114_part_00
MHIDARQSKYSNLTSFYYCGRADTTNTRSTYYLVSKSYIVKYKMTYMPHLLPTVHVPHAAGHTAHSAARTSVVAAGVAKLTAVTDQDPTLAASPCASVASPHELQAPSPSRPT